MPITNAIGEWTGDEDYRSYSRVELDSEEQGWSLSASVWAYDYGASASVSPSIYEVGVFTSAKTYSGSANVRAWRGAGHRWGVSYCSYYHCSGHPMAVPFDADEDPDPENNEIIYATVDMVTMTRVYGAEKSWFTRKGSAMKSEVVVSTSDYVSATAGGEKFTWTQDGVKYWEYKEESAPDQPQVGDSKSKDAYMENWPNANSGAEVSFNFENPADDQGPSTDIEDGNDASYTGVPLQPISP